MQVELRELFYDAVNVFAKTHGLQVSEPNVKFNPPKNRDAQYIKVHTLPVNPSVVTVCGESRNRFILQMDVCSRDGVGELVPLRIVDALRRELFPIHSKLNGPENTFEVIKPVSPSNPIKSDGWFSTPVTLTVQTFNK